MKEKESDIQKLIMDWLKLQGYHVRKNHTTGIPNGKGGFRTNHQKGMPDLTVCLPPNGRLMDIEIKVKGRFLTPEQKEFLENTKNAGGLALVANSLEEVINYLESGWKN